MEEEEVTSPSLMMANAVVLLRDLILTNVLSLLMLILEGSEKAKVAVYLLEVLSL